MCDIVSTPGSATANSYPTIDEADEYFDTRLHAEVWTVADEDTKCRALVMATRLIDRLYDWENYPTTITQVLLWPRIGMLAFNEREFVPDTEIPIQLKQAVAEFGMQLITEDRTLDTDVAKKIHSVTAGPVSVTFSGDLMVKTVPEAVLSLIPPWWGELYGHAGGMRQLFRT